MRSIQSLAGTWQFQVDPEGQITVATLQPTQTIPVPMPWQAAFPEMERYSGYAWYQRDLNIDTAWLNGDVLLTFGAVDYWCEVFLNGTKVGEHEGGYTPFMLTIGSNLQAGRNVLAVRVYDPMQTGNGNQRHPDFPLEKTNGAPPYGPQDIPHGKQEWYINVGGIWQDVTLTVVPKTYIETVHVSGSLDGTATVRVDLGGVTANTQIEAAIVQNGQVVATHTSPSSTFTVKVDNAQWWSLTSPTLYTLHIKVGDDEVSTRFGFREVSTRDGMICVNNEPIYLIAALDQDFYLDTIYTVPSEAYLRDEFQKAKELGLNCLRCHIKPPDPLYLDLADEMGLLVWAEIPSWRTFYPKGTYHTDQLTIDDALKQRVTDTLMGMIKRDFNHPSLMIWTIVNEDWGTALLLSGDDRTWIHEVYDRCKEADPTRLVVDNSACPNSWGPNIHVKSDLDDFHIYANIPDHASNFVNTVQQLDLHALWTYSPHGDADRRGDEPVIVSEFGNWGLAGIAAYLDDQGNEPDWFRLGPWWSGWEGEPGWMKGVLSRFDDFGLAAVFGDYESMAQATQWHQYYALKYQIEVMRRMSHIVGYVITELTDIYWEGNGLLDFARRPKAYHGMFKHINTEDVVVPQMARYVFWADETPRVKVTASHFSPRSWADTSLRITWQGGWLEEPLSEIAQANVQELGTHTLAAALMEQSTVVPLVLDIVNQAGEALAHNTQNILILPTSARKAAYQGAVAVINSESTVTHDTLDDLTSNFDQQGQSMDPSTPDLVSQTGLEAHTTYTAAFIKSLGKIGYNVTKSLSDDVKLAVTLMPSGELLQWVRNGGDLLFLCQGPSPFFWAQSRGGAYGGGWMTSWTWLKPGIHQRIDHAGMNPLTLPFMKVVPTYTIPSLPVENAQYQGDFLAGQISGWVNHPAVNTVQFRYGQGRVVMTTFSLADNLGKQPIATAMFHDLVDHLVERCQPTLQANW